MLRHELFVKFKNLPKWWTFLKKSYFPPFFKFLLPVIIIKNNILSKSRV